MSLLVFKPVLLTMCLIAQSLVRLILFVLFLSVFFPISFGCNKAMHQERDMQQNW